MHLGALALDPADFVLTELDDGPSAAWRPGRSPCDLPGWLPQSLTVGFDVGPVRSGAT